MIENACNLPINEQIYSSNSDHVIKYANFYNSLGDLKFVAQKLRFNMVVSKILFKAF